jgi:hypothetical protein
MTISEYRYTQTPVGKVAIIVNSATTTCWQWSPTDTMNEKGGETSGLVLIDRVYYTGMIHMSLDNGKWDAYHASLTRSDGSGKKVSSSALKKFKQAALDTVEKWWKENKEFIDKIEHQDLTEQIKNLEGKRKELEANLANIKLQLSELEAKRSNLTTVTTKRSEPNA